jgi:hypothetical protein
VKTFGKPVLKPFVTHADQVRQAAGHLSHAGPQPAESAFAKNRCRDRPSTRAKPPGATQTAKKKKNRNAEPTSSRPVAEEILQLPKKVKYKTEIPWQSLHVPEK